QQLLNSTVEVPVRVNPAAACRRGSVLVLAPGGSHLVQRRQAPARLDLFDLRHFGHGLPFVPVRSHTMNVSPQCFSPPDTSRPFSSNRAARQFASSLFK